MVRTGWTDEIVIDFVNLTERNSALHTYSWLHLSPANPHFFWLSKMTDEAVSHSVDFVGFERSKISESTG